MADAHHIQQDDGSFVYTGMLGNFAAEQEAKPAMSYRGTSTRERKNNTFLTTGVTLGVRYWSLSA